MRCNSRSDPWSVSAAESASIHDEQQSGIQYVRPPKLAVLAPIGPRAPKAAYVANAVSVAAERKAHNEN